MATQLIYEIYVYNKWNNFFFLKTKSYIWSLTDKKMHELQVIRTPFENMLQPDVLVFLIPDFLAKAADNFLKSMQNLWHTGGLQLFV